MKQKVDKQDAGIQTMCHGTCKRSATLTNMLCAPTNHRQHTARRYWRLFSQCAEHAAAITAHQVQALPCLLLLLLLVRLLVLQLLHRCLSQTAVQLRWAAQAARLRGPWG
jgi:hypothetical protein